MRLNFSIIILIILFATIIFLLPVTIRFIDASYSADLSNITESSDVFMYYHSDVQLGITKVIEIGTYTYFTIPTGLDDLSTEQYVDLDLGVSCSSLGTVYRTAYNYNGEYQSGGTGGFDCQEGTIQYTHVNYTSDLLLNYVFSYTYDGTTSYMAVVVLRDSIDNKLYILNPDLTDNTPEEEETATSTYPTWDYGTFNTAFLDYEWSSTTTDITVDFQIDISELSVIDRDFYIDALSFCYYEITATSSSNLIACPIYPLDPDLNWFATTTQKYSQFLYIPALLDGDYTAEISFYSIQDMQKTMQGITNIYLDFTVSSSSISNVYMDSISNNLTPPDKKQYKVCNLANLDNCILNALNFAFIPSSNYFTSWLTVWSSLSTSFPFQYLTEILDIFNTKTDTTTDETAHNLTVPVNFGNGTTTMTILNTDTHIENNQYLPTGMFAFIRNLLGLSVWLAMIFYIIGRIKSLNLKLV